MFNVIYNVDVKRLDPFVSHESISFRFGEENVKFEPYMLAASTVVRAELEGPSNQFFDYHD